MPAGVDLEDQLAVRFAGAEGGIGEEGRPVEGRFRDVVVIGASAGGVDALGTIVSKLPPELPAAVFVVLHIGAGGRSVLAAILERAGSLPAMVAEDHQPPERGHIYVASPDKHLLVVGGEIRVTGGPRENGHRPAIDPLFRSAARSFRSRVIAVVLSGTLDDGADGARFVRQRGGAVIVQDPDDALYGDMPRNAYELAGADAILPATAIAAKICELIDEPLPEEADEVEAADDQVEDELAAAQLAIDGTPTELACPDCGGALWEREDGDLVRFGCRVGHVFSPESLVAEHGKELERALWAALRGLEERADLYRRMARRAQVGGRRGIERRFSLRSESAERHATSIRDAIAKLTASGDLAEEPI